MFLVYTVSPKRKYTLTLLSEYTQIDGKWALILHIHLASCTPIHPYVTLHFEMLLVGVSHPLLFL